MLSDTESRAIERARQTLSEIVTTIDDSIRNDYQRNYTCADIRDQLDACRDLLDKFIEGAELETDDWYSAEDSNASLDSVLEMFDKHFGTA